MVHITPAAIDWEQIPVLVDVPQTLKLSNESLITAHFTTNLVQFVVYLFTVRPVFTLRRELGVQRRL